MNEDVEGKICNDMRRIINYFNAKKLILNEKKTSFMIIHSAATKVENIKEILIKAREEDEIIIDRDYTIERVDKTKYLGLIMDECLKWDEHVKKVEMKLSNAAGILWKLRQTLPRDIKKKIYKTLFETHLNYMILVWGSASYNIIMPLQVLQNRALRNVYELDRLTNRIEMYSELVEGNLPIRAMFFTAAAGFVFKTIKRNIFTNIQFDRVGSRTGRRKEYLRPETARTSYGKKRITAIAPRIFNDLPQEIQKSRHIHEFIRAVKIHCQQQSIIETCFNGDFLAKYT